MPAQMRYPAPPTLPSPPFVDPMDAPLLLAVPDAARLLGIGPTFAWELVRSGDLPSVKLGRRVLVPRAALERLADSHMSEGGYGHDDRCDVPHRSGPRAYQPSNGAPRTASNGDRQMQGSTSNA